MRNGRVRGPFLLVALAGALLAVATLALWVGRPPTATVAAQLSISEALGSGDPAGFARATRPRRFRFPRDHGPHPEFRNEWWYVTGNLQTATGREFGVQWTVFRTSLSPDSASQWIGTAPSADAFGPPGRGAGSSRRLGADSAQSVGETGGWHTNQAYMGHFALTDVAAERHHRFERFARGALGLAGARSEPFAVWLEDWRLEGGEGGTLFPIQLHARDAGLTAGERTPVAVELSLETTKPMVLQGDSGLSQKGQGDGNASYYYSYTRLDATGAVLVGGERHQVSGTAWLDREWSTSALAPDQVGWDWFALQLSDGRDLMLYQMRREDGTPDRWSSGTLVDPDGGSRRLDYEGIDLEATGSWSNPRGTVYPSGWRIDIPTESLELEVVPVIPDQEMDVTFRYWEGAVRVSGAAAGRAVTGTGYVELTGYGEAIQPRSVARGSPEE